MQDTPPSKKARLDESELTKNSFKKARLKYSKKLVGDVMKPKMATGGVVSAERLSTKYDAWIMQCPSSVNVNSFLGKAINLPNTTVINSDKIRLMENNHKKKYNITVINGNSTISCVLPSKSNNSFKTTVVPLSGNIILHENYSSHGDDKNTSPMKIKQEVELLEVEVKEEPELYEKKKKRKSQIV